MRWLGRICTFVFSLHKKLQQNTIQLIGLLTLRPMTAVDNNVQVRVLDQLVCLPRTVKRHQPILRAMHCERVQAYSLAAEIEERSQVRYHRLLKCQPDLHRQCRESA